MRSTARHDSLFLPLVLVAALACQGAKEDASPPADDHPAVAFERAKAEAREGAIAETYAEWRAAYLRYAQEAERAAAQRADAASASPVRSVEELLRDGHPEADDPELGPSNEAWIRLSEEYAARLAELRNDPRTDPRSPLLPEVRKALRGDSPEE